MKRGELERTTMFTVPSLVCPSHERKATLSTNRYPDGRGVVDPRGCYNVEFLDAIVSIRKIQSLVNSIRFDSNRRCIDLVTPRPGFVEPLPKLRLSYCRTFLFFLLSTTLTRSVVSSLSCSNFNIHLITFSICLVLQSLFSIFYNH